MILAVDKSSSVHAGNKEKYILILGEGLTQGLNNTKLTVQKKYSIKKLALFKLALQ